MRHPRHSEQCLDECKASYAADHRAQGCGHAVGSGQCCCPSSDSLSRLAANRVWPLTRQRLLRHLATCADCADDYQVMHQAYVGMRAVLQTRARNRRGLWQWLAPLRGAGAAVMQPAVLGTALLLGLCLLMLPTDVERSTDGSAVFADTSHHPGGDDAVAMSMTGDVLFRSDFDARPEAYKTPEPLRQEVFADSFGG